MQEEIGLEMKHIRWRLLVVAGLLLGLFGPMTAFAEESQSPAGFTVESLPRESQVDTTKSYFYIGVQPEQEQTIQVRIKSTRKEPRTVRIQLNNAVTGPNGVIDYTREEPKLDESLKVPLTDFVQIEGDQKEVTVEKFEEQLITFTIRPPKETFSGVKLGAVRFIGVPTEKEEEQGKDGVTQEYAYTIALMVTEDKETFDSGAELQLKNAKLELFGGNRVFVGTIQNDQPKVLTELSIKGYIQQKGSSKRFAQITKENLSVAPNSNFGIHLPAGLENVRPGKYIMTLVARGDDREWKWTKEFQVGEKEAAKINKDAVFRLYLPKWTPYVFGGLLITMVLLTYWLIRRRKNEQNAQTENDKGSEGSEE